jgi:tetratricopeptide (TPR) repeat protein
VANVLAFMGSYDEAVECCRRALALKPDFAEAKNSLANIRKQQGYLDEAVTLYEQALELKPDYAEAHYDLAQFKKFRPGDAELAVLEALAANPERLHPSRLHYIHFALGKAYEDLGQRDRAFEHWLQANALFRRQLQYDSAAEQRSFEQIRQVFDASLLARLGGSGDPSPTPIFIVGMPRSGSTLVEQILASHPAVHGAGELPILGSLAANVTDTQGRPIPYPLYVPALVPDQLRQLGQAYLAALPPLPAGKTRITDKMPANFWYVGLIRLMLPQAKIIHTLRDPVDTCLSCFSRLFTNGQKFSYDLAELGRHWRRYNDLMDHWRGVLPEGAMLDVRYEDVVDNLETQARRLIDFCGLPWDAGCLDFHKNLRPITSASDMQVRQPIYRSSVERWRPYEKHLGPLLAELGDRRTSQ